MARFTARFKHDRIACTVRVLNVVESSVSQASTSVAFRSRSFRAPNSGITCFSQRRRLTSCVAGSRLRNPYVSQSSTA